MNCPERFLDSYISCALWSTNDESDASGGKPLDDNYSYDDLAPETLEAIEQDCNKFWEEYGTVIEATEDIGQYTATDMAGHDFWLTRNGHGSGFWDGDWPKELGQTLTKAAKSFGECHLIVGDDGKIYI